MINSNTLQNQAETIRQTESGSVALLQHPARKWSRNLFLQPRSPHGADQGFHRSQISDGVHVRVTESAKHDELETPSHDYDSVSRGSNIEVTALDNERAWVALAEHLSSYHRLLHGINVTCTQCTVENSPVQRQMPKYNITDSVYTFIVAAKEVMFSLTFLCLFVRCQDYARTDQPMFTEFGGNMAHMPQNKP